MGELKDDALRRVVIVGGGFGGLAAARALAKTVTARVILIDRRNYHVFQPLLYQVATASLSPGDISGPIRGILRQMKNCEVMLGEVMEVDVAGKRVKVDGGWVRYDYLILAAGATHAYFGHDEWAAIAPGLKGIEDATEMRRRLLLAFEAAEIEENEEARRAALTFGIIGGGATGVELAGAIKEIAGKTLPRDYRHIDTRTTRVLLFEGGPSILPAFAPQSQARALLDLKRMGVEVLLNARVTNVTPEGVNVGETFYALRNVFWAAGVKASLLGAAMGATVDRSGRVMVTADLTLPGHPEVFVIGDLAASTSGGKSVPGVAPAAIQMGTYAGRMIAAEVAGKSGGGRKAFKYRDKGNLAVIGKARAVVEIGKFRGDGFLAWLLWAGVHIAFLIGFRNRILVMLNWAWNWMWNTREVRLITGDSKVVVQSLRDGGEKQA